MLAFHAKMCHSVCYLLVKLMFQGQKCFFMKKQIQYHSSDHQIELKIESKQTHKSRWYCSSFFELKNLVTYARKRSKDTNISAITALIIICAKDASAKISLHLLAILLTEVIIHSHQLMQKGSNIHLFVYASSLIIYSQV